MICVKNICQWFIYGVMFIQAVIIANLTDGRVIRSPAVLLCEKKETIE